MNFNDLAQGDILFAMTAQNDVAHCLMFVGGDKAIAHSAAGATPQDGSPAIRGVLLQSKKNYLAKNGVDLDESYCAYRPTQPDGIGAIAAKYAIRWATKSMDFKSPPVERHGVKVYPFKTPYGETKLNAPCNRSKSVSDEDLEHGKMTPEGVLKVVKAYASAREEGIPTNLHPKRGVTCAQFVLYCFQVACLEQIVGGGDFKIPEQYTKDGALVNTFKIKQKSPVIAADDTYNVFQLWEAWTKGVPNKMMEPMRVDTKRVNKDVLFDIVARHGEYFRVLQKTW